MNPKQANTVLEAWNNQYQVIESIMYFSSSKTCYHKNIVDLIYKIWYKVLTEINTLERMILEKHARADDSKNSHTRWNVRLHKMES